MGFIQSEPIVYDNELTYGDALVDVLEKSNELVFIGHRCIKKTPFKLKNC